MKRSCFILNCNQCVVPDPWINTVREGTNRLYYIEGGTGGYIENGKQIPFEKEKLYFLPSYSCVPTYTDETDRLVHSYINFTLTPPIVSRRVFCIDPHKDPKTKVALEGFREFCQPMFSTRIHKPPFTAEEEQRMTLLKALTVYLTEQTVQDDRESILTDSTVITALDIIHANLSEMPSVAEIAAKCYMSTDGFIRKFTRIVGETPYTYIKNLKIRTAMMLRSEGATATEAAIACGYSDASALLHAISAAGKPRSGRCCEP